jgi:hypothetical protein
VLQAVVQTAPGTWCLNQEFYTFFFKHAGEEFYTYVPCKHDNFLVRCFKPLSYSYIKERIIINSFKLIKHGKKHGIVDTICNFWGYTGTTSFTMNNLAIPHLSWNAESLQNVLLMDALSELAWHIQNIFIILELVCFWLFLFCMIFVKSCQCCVFSYYDLSSVQNWIV